MLSYSLSEMEAKFYYAAPRSWSRTSITPWEAPSRTKNQNALFFKDPQPSPIYPFQYPCYLPSVLHLKFIGISVESMT